MGYVLIKKTVSIKTNGIKEHVKKQLLLGNLKELYANFNEENPNIRKVELSTFYKTKGLITLCKTKGMDIIISICLAIQVSEVSQLQGPYDTTCM